MSYTKTHHANPFALFQKKNSRSESDDSQQPNQRSLSPQIKPKQYLPPKYNPPSYYNYIDLNKSNDISIPDIPSLKTDIQDLDDQLSKGGYSIFGCWNSIIMVCLFIKLLFSMRIPYGFGHLLESAIGVYTSILTLNVLKNKSLSVIRFVMTMIGLRLVLLSVITLLLWHKYPQIHPVDDKDLRKHELYLDFKILQISLVICIVELIVLPIHLLGAVKIKKILVKREALREGAIYTVLL